MVASAAVLPIRIGAIVANEESNYDLTVEGDILLGRSEDTDASRVGMLIHRVVHQADALEQEHLPGQDGLLATFRGELNEEAAYGR